MKVENYFTLYVLMFDCSDENVLDPRTISGA